MFEKGEDIVKGLVIGKKVFHVDVPIIEVGRGGIAEPKVEKRNSITLHGVEIYSCRYKMPLANWEDGIGIRYSSDRNPLFVDVVGKIESVRETHGTYRLWDVRGDAIREFIISKYTIEDHIEDLEDFLASLIYNGDPHMTEYHALELGMKAASFVRRELRLWR